MSELDQAGKPAEEGSHGVASFLSYLEQAIAASSLRKLVLGKYRGTEPGLKQFMIRPIVLRDGARLSCVYRYETRDVTRNCKTEEGLELVRGLLGSAFRSGHVFTPSQTIQLEISKKGRGRLSIGPGIGGGEVDPGHDQTKERMIEPSRPFLRTLGVTGEAGQVFPSMSRKWKQINVFLGLFDRACREAELLRHGRIRVVDFGSGKGYLTFAVADYLATAGVQAEVTGIERRADLVRFCRDAAAQLGLAGLAFSEGDVTSHPVGPLEVMIALHACDTATDLAIHAGIRGGASVILCAPCCHRELRPQLVNPFVLEPALRYGVHQGQEAEMVTDTLRALCLEASGYAVQVFEFVSLEHTARNKMILAVKAARPPDPGEARRRIGALKAFYGIRSQTLETLLNFGAPAQ